MEIITEKIVFGGNSIAKVQGKTVFVPMAVPGETLDISIVESKRDYDIGKIEKIIKPSPYRVEPPCKYYGQCGGCNLQHIESAYQKELRKGILHDIFLQNGIDVKDIKVISGPDFNYRARFQLNNGGLSRKNSNEIIPVEECKCAENQVNEYFKNTPFEQRPQGRIHLFGSSFANKGENIPDVVISKLQEKNETPRTNKTNKKLKLKENHYFSGTIMDEKNSITVKVGGKDLSFDVRGFFQSNLFVFEKVVKLIKSTLPSCQNVLDMYAGCGSISAFLADVSENVVLVEHNRDALVYAEKNLMGKKHVSYGMSGEQWVRQCASSCGQFDACVVDPPRSGMEKAVSDFLCRGEIPQIRSLSCDPATHARDCARLIKAGYTLQELYLLDFYPNTSHIESLAIFTK